MANIRAMGDVLMITSNISERIYDSIEKFKPEALELKTEDGKPYFAVNRGPASYSKYGITFSSVNTEGHLFVTTSNVVLNNHTNIEEERAMIAEKFAVLLTNLQKVEEQVAEAATEVSGTLDEVQSMISIEGEV